ncbi:Dak1 domain-domain-containing protein [Kockovaella imperatae]|uniref:Dak1 domain-domain-containing protein n=1 Tax=Kockovaella imperatae TaxID=4999 RepID=A0A1Y1USR2_9TREE|nr:Dak1 domain-domain-containing protein [Kockovaella imperatae]ORX40992.1 Dak1 domain-domain-containing protein [Kockovaella imperatae]
MTDRHLFHDHTTLVVRSLKGLVATHPHLSVIPSLKIVYHANHDPSKVALICGGGSGHEPGTVGFVGQGLLSASVAGDVFASPSAKQVIGGIKAVPSDKGTILIITNYTGDNLHFGLARLMAQSQGLKNVELVVVGDDVSVPRSRGNMVGRRCLAGITLVCKILGAGSEADMAFHDLVDLGRSISTNTASICMALNHCHVPGRDTADWEIPEGRCEIGLGLHNETGVLNIAQPGPEELIAKMLKLVLDQDDPERSFVKFADGDELVLLMNNQGGMSNLEMGAAVDETLNQLEEKGITPVRIFQGCFMGSMNMPGLSISLTNLTNIAKDTGVSTKELLTLIDAPHTSFAWPATQNIYPLPGKLQARKRQDAFTEVAKEEKEVVASVPKLSTSSTMIQKAMRQAAEDVLALEPKLTEWDTIVGDGDCGETCAMGAKGVLEAIESHHLGSDGDLVTFFRELTEVIDDSMGGTLGAILSIFLAGITTSIIDAASQSPQPSITPEFFGQICLSGLETLKQRTAARVGHRTVMDAIIPFSDTLASTGDLGKAAKACKEGSMATVSMQAKLGRATYVGEREDRKELPPDPGAMAFSTVIEGLFKAIG